MSGVIAITVVTGVIYGLLQLMYISLEREDYPHISFREFRILQKTAPEKWEIKGDFFSKYLKYKHNKDDYTIIEMNTFIGEIMLAIYNQRHRKTTTELRKYWLKDIEAYQKKQTDEAEATIEESSQDIAEHLTSIKGGKITNESIRSSMVEAPWLELQRSNEELEEQLRVTSERVKQLEEEVGHIPQRTVGI